MDILNEHDQFRFFSFMVSVDNCESLFRNKIPQRVYIREEMAEVAKELCKDEREKGDPEHIIEEEIDLLNTLFIDLRRRGVSFEDIFKGATNKLERAMDRYYSAGEL